MDAGATFLKTVDRLVTARRLSAIISAWLWLLALAALISVIAMALLFGPAVLLVVLPAALAVAVRWLKNATPAAVVRDIEGRNPALEGRLVAALGLTRLAAAGREGYSPDLVRAALTDADSGIACAELRGLVSRRAALTALALLLVAIVGAVALYIHSPLRALVGAANLLGSSGRIVSLVVMSPDTAVTPGGVVTLRCAVRPEGALREVRLRTRGRRSVTRRLRVDRGLGTFTSSVDEGFTYHFFALGVASEPRVVQLREPLVFRSLTFEYDYPDYSGLGMFRSSATDIRALRGTVVRATADLNRPAAGAAALIGADTVALSVADAHGRVSGAFLVLQDADGKIEAVDSAGARADQGLRIRVVQDEPPLVRVLLPGRDVDVPVSMRLPLLVDVIDDFGVERVLLRYGKDSLNRSITLSSAGRGREDTVAYVWDLNLVELLPGEVLQYRLEALDNDNVSGPKVGRSDVYSVRFPTMAEIYTMSVQQATRTRQMLAPLQAEQQQVVDELGRIGQELDRSRELSWDERQTLAQTLDDQERLAQQIAGLQQELSDVMQQVGEGLAYDGETMEKLGQLEQLLSEVLPRDLQRALADLRSRLQGNSPELRQAMERLQREQELLKTGIDRALELLKQILEEQRLDALARLADELASEQERVTRRLAEQDRHQLAEKQAGLATGLDSLHERTRDLASTISDNALSDSLDALSAEMLAAGLAQQAQELRRMLAAGQTGGEAEKSRSLAEGMRATADRLKSLSEQLKKRRSVDLAERLGLLMRDVLALSEMQEELERSEESSENLARRLAGLGEAARITAESIAAVSGRSMLVSPEVGRDMARALSFMAAAGRSLGDRADDAARSQMTSSRVALNRVARSLLDALERSMQGGGASRGMEGLAEQLSRMAGEQLGINSELGGMPIPMPGGMSPGQIQAIQRLMSRQAALRQQLEQMLQTMGSSQPGMMADLAQAIEEMRAAERDLSELNVTRELIERQQGVLQQLLDAQRSLRQRGQKEEREGEAAKPYQVRAQPLLPVDLGERDRLLREELLRALKDSYPRDYEGLIRSYFERLVISR